jgi:hypothetical protein
MAASHAKVQRRKSSDSDVGEARNARNYVQRFYCGVCGQCGRHPAASSTCKRAGTHRDIPDHSGGACGFCGYAAKNTSPTLKGCVREPDPLTHPQVTPLGGLKGGYFAPGQPYHNGANNCSRCLRLQATHYPPCTLPL